MSDWDRARSLAKKKQGVPFLLLVLLIILSRMKIANAFLLLIVLSLLLLCVPVFYLMRLKVLTVEMAAEASQLITPTEGTRLVVLEGRGNEEAEPVADEKPKVWPKVGPDGRFIDPVEQWEAEHQNDEPTVPQHPPAGAEINPWKNLIPKSGPFQLITPVPDVQHDKLAVPKDFVKEPHRRLKPLKVLDGDTLLYPTIVDEKPIDFDDVAFVDDLAPEVVEVHKAQENYRQVLREHREKLLQH